MTTIRKVHKQVYPATYSFLEEEDGTSGTDIGFIEGGTLYDGSCVIVSDWQSHRKVLRLQDDATAGEDPRIYHDETKSTSGTREFWIGTNDVTEYWRFGWYENGEGYIVVLRITDSALDYLDSLDAWQEIQAVANDTWYHIRVTWRADNTFDCYVDGILKVDNQATNNNQNAGPDDFYLNAYGDSEDYVYLDAYGDPDNDTDYAIGDNIHWRNYREEADSFEEEDWGESGTSIAFVDSATVYDGLVDIYPFFSEHKKVLRLQDDATAGEDPIIYHSETQATAGIRELWIRTTDVTEEWYIYWYDSTGADQIVLLRITASKLYYRANGGAYTEIQAVANDTWYHLKVQWYADDTFDVWVDNVLQVDGVATYNGMTAGIDRFYLAGYGDSTDYIYLDAYGDVTNDADYDMAMNRTFEYHSLSYDDITDDCSLCNLTKSITSYSTVQLESTAVLSELHILQVYDENGDLRFEGNHFKDVDVGVSTYGYIFHDLNKVELEKEQTYTASAAEDVNASLLSILTNVGQEDGRLIYYTEDDPAGNLTPNYHNKPTHILLRLLAIRGGKKGIIKADGRVFLDDDANPDNGAATITETSGEIMETPDISKSNHQINYVEVRGGIDPSTGTRFSGISQDTTAQGDGTGIIPYYKSYRELQSDTDCQNVAIAIRTGTGFTPQIIEVTLRSVYADPGELINFAYSNKSFSATNCYVDSVVINMLTYTATYTINTGIIDPLTFNAPGYTLADETADDIVETDYSTLLVSKEIPLKQDGSAILDTNGSILCANQLEGCYGYFYLSSYFDPDRAVKLHITVEAETLWAGAQDEAATVVLASNPADGTNDVWTTEESYSIDMDQYGADAIFTEEIDVDDSDLNAGYAYRINIYQALNNWSLRIYSATITYYMKRSI